MLAQAVTGTPGHVNSMAMSVGHVLDKVPLAKMNDGDAFIVNDPWQGTGHLNDIVIVTPTFRRGTAVGLFACTLHVVDIGGRGIMGAAQQVYEEGLYIPITKIVDSGEMNQWLIDIITANVREPVQVIGDIYSEIASNDVGGKRLVAMMDEFGLEHLDDLAKHILDHSREASLAAINKLPHGTYRNSMMVDGINGKSMELKAKLTIGPNGIDVDFAGSPGMVQLGINVPLCYTEAYTELRREMHRGAARAQQRGLAGHHPRDGARGLHPERPASRAGRGAQHHRPDAARRGVRLPAAGAARRRAGRGHVVPVERAPDGRHGPRRRRSGAAAEGDAVQRHVGFHSGGTGARPAARRPVGHGLPERRAQRAGRDHRDHRAGADLEQGVPHRFRRRRRASRRPRPGHGVESAEDMPFGISTSFDRVVFPPRGRAGGQSGATGRVELVSGKTLPPKAHSSIPVGERLRVSMPGGGGYGDPRKRPAAKVADDVARGLVSAEKAREHYGVALTADFKVDEAETAKLDRHRGGGGRLSMPRS